jgi:Crinkler effector protein N-terminal domain
MSAVFDINCWVIGEETSRVFPVKIPVTESVGTLRDAIKEKKQAFRNIDADTLELWNVSLLR